MEFQEFPKIARLSRDCVVTEKIDGTNAQVCITNVFSRTDMRVIAVTPETSPTLAMFAGSRTRWITPEVDNHGFAAWVRDHAVELFQLGPGQHFGEWWGSGIQRGYGLQKGEKRFSLFNVARWADDRDREKYPQDRPACCSVVPVLHRGDFGTLEITSALSLLRSDGSQASPGFMNPEGVVIWHEAARILFKKTLEGDTEGKEQKARRLAHAG